MTLRLANLILYDNWPGIPNANQGIPTGGWDNTTDNFTTTSAEQVTRYPAGTKITMYTDNSYAPGNYTMMYLLYHCYCDGVDISDDFSDGNMFCAHHDTSAAEKYDVDTSTVPYFQIGRCYTTASADVTLGMPIAIPCATLDADGTTAYTNGYGDAWCWCWVGGVCPCKDATLLQGSGGSLMGADITVDTLMGKGPVIAEFTGATVELFSADLTNFGDSTAFTNVLARGIGGIGYVCTSDA